MSTKTVQFVKESGGYLFYWCPCKCGGGDQYMRKARRGLDDLHALYGDDGSVICRECKDNLARGTLTRDEILARDWPDVAVEAQPDDDDYENDPVLLRGPRNEPDEDFEDWDPLEAQL